MMNQKLTNAEAFGAQLANGILHLLRIASGTVVVVLILKAMNVV